MAGKCLWFTLECHCAGEIQGCGDSEHTAPSCQYYEHSQHTLHPHANTMNIANIHCTFVPIL